MKEIILKSLTMRNFRGANSTTDFAPTRTIISGWNGSGKSRHFDAFCWCLFGKDTNDRKDYEVKTRENGEPVHKVDTEVTIVLSINGQPISLTRTLKEQWVKPKGQIEEVFKGNLTTCTIDGVPMKVSDYDKAVSEIVSDTLFKMITNPNYFCNMKWQSQREMLFSLVGTISDDEIASGKPEYKELLELISGNSIVDYRKKISAEKKLAKQRLSEIQPRIDQVQSMTPFPKDWELLNKQLADVDAELADIDNKLQDWNASESASNERKRELMNQISELKIKQNQVVYLAQKDADEDIFRKNTEHREITAKIEELTHSANHKRNLIEQAKQQLMSVKADIVDASKQRESLLAMFAEISEMEYNGSDKCPHCGQTLPDHMMSSAIDGFEKEKDRKLNNIQEQGKKLNEHKQMLVDSISELENEIKAHETVLNDIDTELTTLREKVVCATNLEKITVKPETLPAWMEIETKIKELEKQSNKPIESSGKITESESARLKTAKAEKISHRDEILRFLAEKDTIAKNKEEIASLQERGKELAAEIAGYEQKEFVMTNFSRDKITLLEERVNSIFKKVRFQLFDKTIDGNEVEVCFPIVNGAPYGVANNAAKVMAGLEIINMLQNYYDVKAPIFLDNAEAFSRLPEVESQTIYLTVSTDENIMNDYKVIKN